ncbi:uncharacterized protein EV420DRAFT_1597412 [Desarmillaria tabescens]|uniref:Ubiquinol-cytochrome C reductase hinge domain-containing protein n=1 Tax=Armillaria tabescens TaxID=1929756 RepID=A0AA39MGS3_ARMTA|nr:uncharacterized protein EV420DRAFT_1597412 [Desarmillaria tabescens]KAK0434266.1 hypothetical protein EV420DRAFT_1597412 [Desarmillaria tabescens]
MSSITSFFSSFLPTAHCDSEDKPEESPAEEVQQEEEEEERPEDVSHFFLCWNARNPPKCAALAKHYEYCQEKVSNGEGFKGEDC